MSTVDKSGWDPDRCQATNKKRGEQCKNYPVRRLRVCLRHGGGSKKARAAATHVPTPTVIAQCLRVGERHPVCEEDCVFVVTEQGDISGCSGQCGYGWQVILEVLGTDCQGAGDGSAVNSAEIRPIGSYAEVRETCRRLVDSVVSRSSGLFNQNQVFSILEHVRKLNSTCNFVHTAGTPSFLGGQPLLTNSRE